MAPVASSSAQMSMLPGTISQSKAMRVPSGDHAGDPMKPAWCSELGDWAVGMPRKQLGRARRCCRTQCAGHQAPRSVTTRGAGVQLNGSMSGFHTNRPNNGRKKRYGSRRATRRVQWRQLAA